MSAGRTRGAARALAATAAVTLGLTACGGSSSGGAATASRPIAGRSGRTIFTDAGCSGCHTLAAAGAEGNIGPDLDRLKPTAALVRHQVIHGGGGMPAFQGKLTPAQIDAVATFVAAASRAR